MISFEEIIASQGSGSSQILMGSVGWDDQDDYYFLGSASNDGYTLVRVQLFEGRDFTKPLNPKRAQGHKLVCHLSGNLFRIPPKDTRVFVAVPPGMEHVAGAGVIFATVEKTPPQLTGDKGGDPRVVMDFGPSTHVVIRGKSVSLQDPDNRFISVGTPRSGGAAGLTFQAKDGTGGVIQDGVVGWFVAQGGTAKTILQMTPTKMEATTTAGGYWGLDANFHILGSSIYVQGGKVYLGTIPTALQSAIFGPTGIAGVASTSVFLSI